MNFGDNDIGDCSKATFGIGTVVNLSNLSRSEVEKLVLLTHQNRYQARSNEMEVAISTMALSYCLRLDVDPTMVAREVGPLINMVLKQLAMRPQNWALENGSDADRFRDVIGELATGAQEMNVLELLGIRERRANRYLVRRPGKPWTSTDDVTGEGEEPAEIKLDAYAIAADFAAKANGPYFTWRSSGPST